MQTEVETERKYLVKFFPDVVEHAVRPLATEVLSIVHIYPDREPGTRYGQMSRNAGDFEYVRVHKGDRDGGSRPEATFDCTPEEWAYHAGLVLRGDASVVIKARYCWEEAGLLWELDLFDHPAPPPDYPFPRLMLLEVEGVAPGDEIQTPEVFEALKNRTVLSEYRALLGAEEGLVDVTDDDRFYAVNIARPLNLPAGVLS